MEPLTGQRYTPAGRALAVAACLVAAGASLALVDGLPGFLIGALALAGAVAALAMRSASTTVEAGMVITRFAASPLLPARERVITGDRIAGVEILVEHDPDALPARKYAYAAGLRLHGRRRPVTIGAQHFERARAERDAAALRQALGL